LKQRLHSFHTALGRGETPFFGASQKQKRGKRLERAPFFAVPAPGLGAYVEFINRFVQLTVSASPGPAPSRVAYTVSSPPRLSPPPLRLPRRAYARREAEKPYASVMAQVFGHRLHQSVHKRRRAGRAEAAGVRPAVAVLKWTPVYIAGDGCSSSSGLTHLSPLRSNLKPSLLHVSRYLLNCLLSIGAVLFT